jgi:hypothetical protein
MPWEVWPKGCPKCGCMKVDVTVIHDKLGRVKDAHVVQKEPLRKVNLDVEV